MPINRISLSSEEQQNKSMSEDNLQLAVESMAKDGGVVISNAVDPANIAVIHSRMMEDLEVILEKQKMARNFVPGHIQQELPPFKRFLFPDVFYNPYAAQITKRILGKKAQLTFASANTNLPGSGEQPVHTDTPQLWPNLEHPTPPYGIVINVTVVDVTAHNGGTEIWPGTHVDVRYSFGNDRKISQEHLNERSKVEPPVQPETSPGDIVLRDIRLWHRGMPNNAQEARPMIAFIHHSPWWRGGSLTLDCGCREFVEEHANVVTVANYESITDHAYLFKAEDCDIEDNKDKAAK